MLRRWYLIANPAAGRGRAHRLAAAAARALSRAGCPVELRYTERPGHGALLAAEALGHNAERLVVAGGDGTIREVLPVLSGSRLPLGLLPAGTANDLARALGIPSHLRGALHVLLHGRVRTIDLGQAGDQPFATVATFGFDSAVNRALDTRQVPFNGTVGYLLAALRSLPHFQCPEVHLSGDFGEYRGRALLVASGNTASYGGGLRIVPGAEPADGSLDVCIVGPVSAATVLWVMPRLWWGGHARHPQVRLLRTTHLHIETREHHPVYADGDWIAHTPVTLCALPHALQVIVPGPQPVRDLRAAALAWVRGVRLRPSSLPGTPLLGIFPYRRAAHPSLR
ncbi:MAG: diacylglycerol kinase family protein [Candidatus Latescibacterota bacterium]